MRTTDPITTKHGSFIAMVMVITWFDFGQVLLEIVVLKNFLQKFRMWFFKVKTLFWAYLRNGWSDVKWKGRASVEWWVWYVTLTFDLTHDLDLGCFKVKFWNSCISGIIDLIDVKRKGTKLKGYRADYMTLPFDHTHDLDLGVSRSESERAVA